MGQAERSTFGMLNTLVGTNVGAVRHVALIPIGTSVHMFGSISHRPIPNRVGMNMYVRYADAIRASRHNQ